MEIWIDAQLSPSLAVYLNQSFSGINAFSLSYLGLSDAKDLMIFQMQSREML